MNAQEWATLKTLADALEQMARQMEEQREQEKDAKQKRPVKIGQGPKGLPIPPQRETA